ncbi:MAG TPA: hypothetical protein VF035_00130 [Longimicrobiales bacterium]
MAKVLVVEVDMRLKITYDILLQKEGHTVERALNGEEALQKDRGIPAGPGELSGYEDHRVQQHELAGGHAAGLRAGRHEVHAQVLHISETAREADPGHALFLTEL